MTILVRFQLLLAVTTLMLVPILGFVPLGLFRPHGQHEVCRKSMTAEEVEEEEAGNALFEEEKPSYVDLDAHEKTWRHAKKPLLSIGSKGATHSHGNSLRQLLNDHTVVKVKVNTKKFGTLEKAATALRDLAVENGASKDMEIIQKREKDRIILYGLPGTLERMKEGTFPPPPPQPKENLEELSA